MKKPLLIAFFVTAILASGIMAFQKLFCFDKGPGYERSKMISHMFSNGSFKNKTQVVKTLKILDVKNQQNTIGKDNLSYESDYVYNSQGLSRAHSMIVVMIPDVGHSFLDRWFDVFIFIFDDKDILIRYKKETRALSL